MSTMATPRRPSKTKAARRRSPAGGLSGAALLARASKGEFGRGIDWAAVTLAYTSRRRRPRSA